MRLSRLSTQAKREVVSRLLAHLLADADQATPYRQQRRQGWQVCAPDDTAASNFTDAVGSDAWWSG